jgi:serine phosphatase RsbU (regulator of sigma subunit)
MIESLPEHRFANVTAWSSPAGGALAGGDWCEVIAVAVQTLVLTIGDVSGHGRSVVEPMIAIRTAVVQSIHDIQVPSEVLSVANDVALTWGDGILVTAIVAVVDCRLRTLTFANAGHPPPLLFAAGSHAFLKHAPADIPLGVFPGFQAATYVVSLPSDALLTLYTDGVTEHARDPVRGEEELVEAARFVCNRPDLDAARAIAFHIFTSKRGVDDAAVLALRLMPGALRT